MLRIPHRKILNIIESHLSLRGKIVRGIVTRMRSQKDILVYTKEGMGQRLDPNTIRITSPNAKGGNGFKLKNDEIVGCYAISPEENSYLVYTPEVYQAYCNQQHSGVCHDQVER